MSVELLDITADAYHADPCETPSLNATVAKALVLKTPAHARQKHPRLGSYVPRHTDAMDEGTALHQMLLGDDRCDILESRLVPWWRREGCSRRVARSGEDAGVAPQVG